MYTSFRNATKQPRKYDARAKLGGQPDIKLNTVLQFRYQRRIYPLFRVLSTITTPSEN